VSAPDLRLEAREAMRVDGMWRVQWRVTNAGGDHVRLLAVRAPHPAFRSEPQELNALVIESASFEQAVSVEGEPGADIENAFVIFVAVKDRETWRVLFRVRVHLGPDGTPAPQVEAASTHRIALPEV
jgi:hypothetical protein